MRLTKSFGAERLEAACTRADHLRAYSFKSVQSILQNKLDLEPILLEENRRDVQFVHGNLRGAAYYKSETLRENELALKDKTIVADSTNSDSRKRN